MNHNKFAVIDIETPNRHQDSICSIGIVIIENGEITNKIHHLIDPEAQFDESNISIHSITPDEVEGKPTFPEIWERIKEIFSGYLLAGHNLRFDLSCIKKAMQRYHIEASPVYYIDTLTLSRSFVEDICSYKLNVLCQFFNIPLDRHHDAICDSTATAELLLNLIEIYNIDIDEYITKYDFQPLAPSLHKNGFTENTKALQELQGILYGVVCDNELNDDEILFTEKWLRLHKELKGNFPYDKIYSKIEVILEDRIITEDERADLFALINRILNPVDDTDSDICIQIEDSSICLTGDFECMSRNELSALLESMGAIVKKNVTKTLNYLLVGNKGSDKWSQGNYGTKVKKAMEYNENGSNIEILKENDILSVILDKS